MRNVGLEVVESEEQNEIDYTYHKNGNQSHVDYFIVSNEAIRYVSKKQIVSSGLTTDHLQIKISLQVNELDNLNKPNVNEE